MPMLSNQNYLETPVSGAVGVDLGFQARSLRLLNDKATPVYVSLNSTAGSTAGHRTCGGETLSLDGVAFGGYGLASTTTSTGTIVRVSAWGA